VNEIIVSRSSANAKSSVPVPPLVLLFNDVFYTVLNLIVLSRPQLWAREFFLLPLFKITKLALSFFLT